MKKLIQLHGVHDSGKTTVIRFVFDLLVAKYPDAKIDDQSTGRTRKKGPPEVRAILVINKIRIGIGSHGDNKEWLEWNLDWFLKEKCQLIVCATRSRGETDGAIMKFVEDHPSYVLERVEKRRSGSVGLQQEENKAATQKIIQLIKDEIGK